MQNRCAAVCRGEAAIASHCTIRSKTVRNNDSSAVDCFAEDLQDVLRKDLSVEYK